MNRQEINQRAEDIIREEKRTKEVISTGSVLDNIVPILNSVMVDREYMKQCVEEIVANSSGKGLFNAVLKLFGFKAIRTDMNIQFKSDNSHNRLDFMLKLDKGAFKSAISEMASSLADYEKKAAQEREDAVNRINELITKQDEQERKNGELKKIADKQFGQIIKWIQDMLGSIGKEESDNLLGKQLEELMKDLDVEAYWEAENMTLHEAAMFSEMKVDDTSKYKEKPCIVCRGEVVAKGIRFCKAERIGEKEKE